MDFETSDWFENELEQEPFFQIIELGVVMLIHDFVVLSLVSLTKSDWWTSTASCWGRVHLIRVLREIRGRNVTVAR